MILLFLALSFLSILSALCVVFLKNPIHSVLSLIVCFFSLSGHFLLLQSEFLAVVQIIVYAGAIMVLFLFILMLINLSQNSEPRKKLSFMIFSGLAVMALAVLLILSLKPALSSSDGFMVSIQDLGHVLFNDYLMPFEFSSLLFLSALVGVVVLSKRAKVKK